LLIAFSLLIVLQGFELRPESQTLGRLLHGMTFITRVLDPVPPLKWENLARNFTRLRAQQSRCRGLDPQAIEQVGKLLGLHAVGVWQCGLKA